MPRLKFLLLAIAVLIVGYLHLAHEATAADAAIRQGADDRLHLASQSLAPVLAQEGQAALGMARAMAQGASVAQAMSDDGTPTAEALEAARALVEKAQAVEAERPVLVVVAAQGVAGRARNGQSNRFDQNLSAFPPLAEPGPLPRAGLGVLDGETYRYAITGFEQTKAPGSKGLIAVGFPLDDVFATKLRSAAGGLEISLVEKGKVVGSTLPASERAALDAAAKKGLKGTFGFGGLTGEAFNLTDLVPPLSSAVPLPLLVSGQRYRAQVVGLSGTPLPEGLQVVAAVRTENGYAALADDQRDLLLGLLALVALALASLVTSGDAARGLSRVVSSAERIVQGDYDGRAPTDRMTPLVRRAAVAINTLATHTENAARPVAPSFAEQLGIKPGRSPHSKIPAPAEPPEFEAQPEQDPFAAFAPPEPAQPQPTPEPAAGDVDSFLAGSSVPTTPPDFPPEVPAAAAPHPTSYSPTPPNSNPMPTPMPMPSEVTAAPTPAILPQRPKSTFAAQPPPSEPPLARESEGQDFGHDRTVVAATPDALIRATQRTPSFGGMPGGLPTAGPAGNAPAAVPLPGNASEEGHFQQVFREFVSTRERCGEPADGLTYEKFAAKLRKNQEQLIAKYACRSVRFQVYVKEGKAALKATPVR